MSSYPPPPPPQGFPPVYTASERKAQQKLMQGQYKLQRQQMRERARYAARANRRSSILGPLMILAAGLVFLLGQTGRLSWMRSLQWYGRWWPAVMIAAGVLLLVEWAFDERRQRQSELSNAGGQRGARTIGGGVVTLLILLAVAGVGIHAGQRGIEWKNQNLGEGFGDLDHVLGDRHDSYDTTSISLNEGAALVIRNPHGDVTVTGSSQDGQLHVSTHLQTYAWNNRDANSKAKQMTPHLSSEGSLAVLTVGGVDGGHADVTVEVPRSTPVTIHAEHGDVSVSELHAPATLFSNHGDVSATAVDGAVAVHVNDDNADVSMHSLGGGLTIEGHTGDVNLADVAGGVTMKGDFFGTTHIARVSGPVRFDSSRTQFEAERLDGEFEVENDELQANGLLGPVTLATKYKNITLEQVQGPVKVSNYKGDVTVTSAPPLGAVDITNEQGSVDLGLPSTAGFMLDATTRSGDVENDFGLPTQENGDTKTLDGRVGGGGPEVTVHTTSDDVTVRKTSLASLPPAPPAPPRITLLPGKPQPPQHPGRAPRQRPSTPPVPPAPPAPPSVR